MTIARAQGVTATSDCDKMPLLERCAPPKAFTEIASE
jgi:hypothetical protein